MTMRPIELRRKRKALKLTQAALAKLLGVSWRSVARWESDKGEPPQLVDMVLQSMKPMKGVKS